MPEFFLELFSEEIPARMQAAAAAELERRLKSHLSILEPHDIRTWYGPRRIVIAAQVSSESAAVDMKLRGPRLGTPEAALDGFLRKNSASQNEIEEKDGFYILRRRQDPECAADVVRLIFVGQIWHLPWPKSMRWGESGDFTWVRPLRRVVCLLDGEIVPITLGPVTASNESEGHRFMAPGAFKVTSAAQWETELDRRYVIADAVKRRARIEAGLKAEAESRGLTLAEDTALLDEVTGLVEWPVPLIGCIEPQHMALPPEVRELSMKVNQRYFALRDAAGNPAPFFAFVANIEASDGGSTIIAGNERVLRARLADAEHFWNLDRKHPLSDYLPKLKSVTFHAKLGTQFDRAGRIAQLAREIAKALSTDSDAVHRAETAGLLCKADLVTGMVGEFPELQGIMGGYYADDPAVGAAIRTHYQPKGPSDDVPRGVVPCAVALADKIDTLREFFRIGETPTGSGDPYALRRAALGVIRILLDNRMSLYLSQFAGAPGLIDFIFERMRVKLRGENKRYDVINALLAKGIETNLVLLVDRMEALAGFLCSDDGVNLMTGYRRASNILEIENAKDGPHQSLYSRSLLAEPAEIGLADALERAKTTVDGCILDGNFSGALSGLAGLRKPIDEFFEKVTVNAADPILRLNRLALLFELRGRMHAVADFSKLEG